MATQKYKNLAQSTLAVGYTAGNTTITVATGEGALFPTAGDFYVAMDNPPSFFLKCTSRATDVLTVSALGQEGTTAVNKAVGVKVTQVITAAALDGIRSDLTGTGTTAAIPTPEKDGNVYLPSDGIKLFRDTGAAFVGWGPIWPLADPTLQTWAWVNQGGASVVEDSRGISLIAPANASRNLRIRVKSAPATPYTITVGMFVTRFTNVDNPAASIIFRESSSGKIQNFGTYIVATNSGLHQYTDKWTDATTPNSSYKDILVSPMGSLYWLRIRDDGSSRYCDFSTDGINFINFHSVGRTDFLTANQVGFMVEAYNNTPVTSHILSWKES